MKSMLKFVLITLPMFHAVSALGQETDMDETMIEVRQSLMQVIVWNIAPLGGMIRGAIPFDPELAAKNGQRISQLGTMIPDAFERDTSGSSYETEALDVIWETQDDFNAKAETLVAAAAAYAEAAQQGEEEAKKAFGRVGGACSGCHEDFRVDDED